MFDHLRGGGEHPSIPVPSKWRTRHHPLCPSGSEFIARAIRRWLEASGVNPLHRARISLGARLLKETFISHFSDEMLKGEIFADQLVAKVLVEDYCDHYNHHRPHSALGYQTPAEFGASADLDMKVEDVRKPEELESVLTLS